MLDQKDTEEQSKEISRLLNDLARVDDKEQEEVDKLFDTFEQEIFEEEISEFGKEKLNTPRKFIAQESSRIESTRTSNKKQDIPIEDLLLQASSYN